MSDKIIVFDGVCVLCSGWVHFVLKRDRSQMFKFAGMQTATGAKLLTQHGIDPNDPVTFLLVDGEAAYTDTDAALRVVNQFGGIWRGLALLGRCVPRFIRNSLYRYIARNRYRFFGRRASCLLPPADLAQRFLQ